MNQNMKFNPFVSGLALFSMFFGAGNVVFPLILGATAADLNNYAIPGLILTAVIMPCIGVIAMALYQGDYEAFFSRLGKFPSIALILITLAIIGPFAAIPRTVTLSASIFDYAVFNVTPWIFNLLSCVLIYFLTIKKKRLIQILGAILTPLLLFFLVLIIGKGIFGAPPAPSAIESSKLEIFLLGIIEGYNTLDLLAALFFSTLVVLDIRANSPENMRDNPKYIASSTLKACAVGGILLALIYVGMMVISAHHAQFIQQETVQPDQFLAALTIHLLGSYSGIVAALAAALACLTTAITLAAVFAEMLRKHVLKSYTYETCVLITVIITFIISLLGFGQIVRIVAPALIICYPVFIALCLFNIAYKLYGVKMVKTPVAIVFLISLYMTVFA